MRIPEMASAQPKLTNYMHLQHEEKNQQKSNQDEVGD
jgi:hypothetical protein